MEGGAQEAGQDCLERWAAFPFSFSLFGHLVAEPPAFFLLSLLYGLTDPHAKIAPDLTASPAS